MMSKNRKSVHSFCPGTSRDRGVCPGTFAPALCPRTRFFLIFLKILTFFWQFFTQLGIDSVPGQRSLSRDIYSYPCPGTKVHRDKENVLVPGQRDSRTSRPLETLMCRTVIREVRVFLFYLICISVWNQMYKNIKLTLNLL